MISAILLIILAILSLLALSAGMYRMRWAFLVPATDRQYPLNLPHADLSKGFRWIPRSATAFMSSKPPTRLFGTNPPSRNMDNPLPGTWVAAMPAYFALMTKGHRLSYIGFRWDYNDKYYNLDATSKKV